MANNILNSADKLVESFDENLFKVLKELDKRVLSILSAAKTGTNDFDAAVLLNSRAEMIAALRESGYNRLAEEYISSYKTVPDIVREAFAGRDLPQPKFATADATTFRNLAKADLEAFNVIGEKAMDDLRLGLYRQAVGGQSFPSMVETIRAATVGLAKNGSPLKNYAYTHANTAILNFSGEVIIKAGESIDADKWEVVGPNDGVTRDECLAALGNPVRTKEEWIAAGYWGGTPGGWNCRHQFYPYLGDD